MNARFSSLRDHLLRGHPWSFAKKVASAGVSTGTSTLPESDGLTLRYAYPADLGRLLRILDSDGEPAFYKIRGAEILTDADPAYFEYISCGDTAFNVNYSYQDDFAEALAWLLASDICVALSQNNGMRELCMQNHLMALSTARFNGAIELPPLATIEAIGWISSRNTPGSVDPRTRGFDIPDAGV